MNELIKINDNAPTLPIEVIKNIITTKAVADKAKAEYDNLRAKLLEEMENKGIKKLETPEIILTYKAPYDSEKFDKDRFKVEHPEMYDDYTGITHNKQSIVIKVL